MVTRKTSTLKRVTKKSTNTRKITTQSKKPIIKVPVYKEKQTRIEILQTLAEQTQLTRVQVESIFDALNRLAEGHMKKRGSGEFTIPKTGIKICRVKKKATKSRKMVSPLTGKEVAIPAKPPRAAIKVTVLKVLKEMVEK